MFLTTTESLPSVHLDSWPTLVSLCLTHLSGSLTKRNLSLCCFCDSSPSQDTRKWPATQMDTTGHQRYSQSLGPILQNSVPCPLPLCQVRPCLLELEVERPIRHAAFPSPASSSIQRCMCVPGGFPLVSAGSWFSLMSLLPDQHPCVFKSNKYWPDGTGSNHLLCKCDH